MAPTLSEWLTERKSEASNSTGRYRSAPRSRRRQLANMVTAPMRLQPWPPRRNSGSPSRLSKKWLNFCKSALLQVGGVRQLAQPTRDTRKEKGRSAMLDQNRREFIGKSFVLGTAGLLTSSLAGIAQAQTLGAMRRSGRYEDSFIFERKAYSWPNNKSLAIWIAPNVEVWHY